MVRRLGFPDSYRTTIETRHTVADSTQLHTDLSELVAQVLHQCQSSETDYGTAATCVRSAFADAIDLPNTHEDEIRFHVEHILVMLVPRAKRVFSWLSNEFTGPKHGMGYPSDWLSLGAVYRVMRGIELLDSDQSRIKVANAIRTECPEPWPAIRFHQSYPHLSSHLIDWVAWGLPDFEWIRQRVELDAAQSPKLKDEIATALVDSSVDWQQVLNEPVVGTICITESQQAARMMARDMLQTQKRSHDPTQWT